MTAGGDKVGGGLLLAGRSELPSGQFLVCQKCEFSGRGHKGTRFEGLAAAARLQRRSGSARGGRGSEKASVGSREWSAITTRRTRVPATTALPGGTLIQGFGTKAASAAICWATFFWADFSVGQPKM